MKVRSWMPIWTIPLLIAFAITSVWIRLSIVGTSYSIDLTDRAIRDLQQQKQEIGLRVAALRSPRRLELLAKTRYGLEPARSEQVIHLEDAALSAPVR